MNQILKELLEMQKEVEKYPFDGPTYAAIWNQGARSGCGLSLAAVKSFIGEAITEARKSDNPNNKRIAIVLERLIPEIDQIENELLNEPTNSIPNL